MNLNPISTLHLNEHAKHFPFIHREGQRLLSCKPVPIRYNKSNKIISKGKEK